MLLLIYFFSEMTCLLLASFQISMNVKKKMIFVVEGTALIPKVLMTAFVQMASSQYRSGVVKVQFGYGNF